MNGMNEYEISARHYLSRMRARLAEPERPSLFYAAFELRCGVESRLQQYAEVANDVAGRKKMGWRVAKLAATVEAAFATGDRIVELTLPGTRLFFTPVRASLRKMAEQMGNYLHAMQRPRDASDPWWDTFRRTLDEGAESLAWATTGTLLGPPLQNSTGKLRLYVEGRPEDHPHLPELLEPGTRTVMGVRHLDELPGDVWPRGS